MVESTKIMNKMVDVTTKMEKIFINANQSPNKLKNHSFTVEILNLLSRIIFTVLLLF